jgi:hypothetical protein
MGPERRPLSATIIILFLVLLSTAYVLGARMAEIMRAHDGTRASPEFSTPAVIVPSGLVLGVSFVSNCYLDIPQYVVRDFAFVFTHSNPGGPPLSV